MARITIIGCFLFLFLTGCSLFESRCEEPGACDDAFSERVRVIPGRGVDGVEFGDSFEEVRATLGTADGGLGWTDGLYRSWRSLYYNGGPHAGLMINFLIEEDGATPGSVDMFILFSQSQGFSQYQGTTREGIGIGSSIEEVERVFGEPDSVSSAVSVDYTYCFGEKYLNLSIQADTVSGMSMGYSIPIPEGHYSYCQ